MRESMPISLLLRGLCRHTLRLWSARHLSLKCVCDALLVNHLFLHNEVT